jgi:acetyl esterase/lipase
MLDAVSRRARPRAAVRATCVAACLGATLTACSGDAPTPSPASSSPTAGEYLPGLAVTVDRPRGEPPAVFLLVPGGAFRTADPTGMRALGDALAAEGFAAVTITYDTSATGTYYPRPVEEVACGLAYAASQVPDVPVVVVGHSAGANLAMLVALQPTRTDVTCPYEPTAADGVVGLAGVYDVHRSYIGELLFGVPQEEDPELWRDGNPLTWSAERPEVPALLVHGLDDELAPVWFSQDMAAALEEGGHQVTAVYPDGARHSDVIAAEWVLDDLVDWVNAEVLAPED